ncbi:type II toxin-antitoxin system death-on-curing family toxin [Quadrisphaera sp. DSM 44207]|uniref:type II toxin-antitoxin system death-on-curing family toxin n=1 Tax=Quadrisphaera sp. DSM 44207 TaxID=1881057 RepID=UPI00088EB349|nr:type II toxin-antitoxin system death-on-curing family toxin [Quadrisphaera sp. DSM 44207]SDQ05723.1 death on curing protein [Quadrisphaera sp. DSM 44207]
MIYLTAAELLHVAERATGASVQVRDHGLLAAAAARPQVTVQGEDAYHDLSQKAAALMHSLARNHPLVDGDKRLALGGCIAFLGINGYRLTLSNDEAYDLTMAIAAGELDEVHDIARRIRGAIVER